MGHWVAKKIRGNFNPNGDRAIGLESNGEPVAGVIYEDWNGKSVVCHLAIEGRITRNFLYAIFHYPFKALGVEKIIAPVAESNLEARMLVERMGSIS